MKKSIVILIVFILCLAGCQKEAEVQPTETGKVFHIFMYDTKAYDFVSREYPLIEGTNEENVKEIMARYEETKSEGDLKNPLSGAIKYTHLTITARTLTINLSSDYYQVTALEDVVFRTAMVRTFSELEDIDAVEFQIAGLPITDKSFAVISSKGTKDIVDSLADVTSEKDYKSLTVYYMDKETGKLTPMIEAIPVDPLKSLEENLVDYIFHETSRGNYISIIPEDVEVLAVNVDNNVCYINLSSSFTKHSTEKGVSGEHTIYGIVNAITELPNINKVQFLIEGEISEEFRGEIPLNQVFDRRLDLIQQ